MPTLVIGNKCYSSWSLRPWLLLRQLGKDFDEVIIPLDTPQTRAEMLKYSETARVPVLKDGDITVWDSIAIMEYAADAWQLPVWPAKQASRAMARAVSAEMHSGFTGLRSACPMNLGKRYARKDRGAAVAADVARIESIFRTARQAHQAEGPFLFGQFSAADAMFAPVVTRLDTYNIPVSDDTRQYMDTILSLPAFKEWLAAGLKETWIVPSDEVDEEPTEILRKL
ncbi:glutathione S-transferase family protein [Microvirga sp. W0021]|uniref:Glutathione S-transferase family protein n=1 Tax=Hohaiivirga grylli TaxID=3133970 RepID=A0ABV0BK82_9HYPH